MTATRVLVTGGLGFIGSNVAEAFAKRGARITVFDNGDPLGGGNSRNLDEVAGDIELITGDIRDAEAVARVVRDAEVIIHCAAQTSHMRSMQEPLLDLDVNARGTLTLLEAVRKTRPDAKLVHIGTSTQIGRATQPDVTELHPEFPLDMYSANKTATEKYVLLYANAHNLRTTVIRLANNFGPRAHIRSTQFGFVNFFIGQALQGKELTVYGTGTQLRNISFVADSVDAILAAVESDAGNGQTLFAVADRQLSVLDCATAITTQLGGSVRSIPWPPERAVIEVGDTVIRNQKIREILGWRPRFQLDEALQLTRAFYETRLATYL